MRVCIAGESVQRRGGGALLHRGWLGEGERGQERTLFRVPGSSCPASLDGRPAAASRELSLAPGHPLQAVRARSLPLLELPLSCQLNTCPPFIPSLRPVDVNPTARLGFRGSGLPPASGPLRGLSSEGCAGFHRPGPSSAPPPRARMWMDPRSQARSSEWVSSGQQIRTRQAAPRIPMQPSLGHRPRAPSPGPLGSSPTASPVSRCRRVGGTRAEGERARQWRRKSGATSAAEDRKR